MCEVNLEGLMCGETGVFKIEFARLLFVSVVRGLNGLGCSRISCISQGVCHNFNTRKAVGSQGPVRLDSGPVLKISNCNACNFISELIPFLLSVRFLFLAQQS